MLNGAVILLAILTLPIWIILLMMISPILLPVAFFGFLCVLSKMGQRLGEGITKYENSVIKTREALARQDEDFELNIEAEERPRSTPDKLLQKDGYTIEMYLSLKPPVYRILDPNQVDFGINYKTLAEALHEIKSYTT